MSKPGIRIDDDLYTWLMDHRDSKRKTVSDVIRELKEFWERSERKHGKSQMSKM